MAMELDGVSIASLVFFIKPALAPILAMILIHEKMTLSMIIGIVIILLGSVVTFISNRVQDKQLQNSRPTEVKAAAVGESRPSSQEVSQRSSTTEKI